MKKPTFPFKSWRHHYFELQVMKDQVLTKKTDSEPSKDVMTTNGSDWEGAGICGHFPTWLQFLRVTLNRLEKKKGG